VLTSGLNDRVTAIDKVIAVQFHDGFPPQMQKSPFSITGWGFCDQAINRN
jgi:hypothetical protein